MTEDQDAKDSHSDSGSKTFVNKNKDKKAKPQRPLTKIILRRLPATMTEEAFLEQVSPIPEHDYFYFAKPDTSLGNNIYSRAYINFVNVDDIYLFRDKFDGYVFLDEKGLEYVGIVEYAPFQRIPKKKKKKDPKCGTLESDPIYQEFLEYLSKDQEADTQPKLEYSYPVNDGNEKKVQTTPLLEYLAARKQDKRGRDERRRRENDKRKMRIERKSKDSSIREEDIIIDNDVKKIKPRDWEKDRSNDVKDDSDIYDSHSYKDRKMAFVSDKKKKFDDKKGSYKGDEDLDEFDIKKDKCEKVDSPREQKSKKYSDSRKERFKLTDAKSEKPSAINKMMSEKPKTLNHDDIKPFTQLPHVKTEDLSKLLDSKSKGEDAKLSKTEKINKNLNNTNDIRMRRNSLEPGDLSKEGSLERQKSLEDRSRSIDREGSEEKEKSDSIDCRTERRIRNKDRPSLVIYQPGMGKFSKQRLAKDKDPPTSKTVNESEKKDT
ncbi:regulator of nonsense transcripts 3B-like [Pieris napi]|uniref:regulator of nonsense transcripts 3B-like n=1 Tax=Pieris napi TaxID=78633 RepID=UPI001FBA9854|nr:regulator of nonsense transcripts 3B-like [Pieris napi]